MEGIHREQLSLSLKCLPKYVAGTIPRYLGGAHHYMNHRTIANF